MMTKPLLQFTGLRRSLGDRVLWQIPQLFVPVVGNLLLRGDNGVGKTLLLKTLAGLIQIDCQVLKLQGEPVLRQHWQQRLRATAVYVHSQTWLFDRTVEANVAYGLRCRGWHGTHLRERVWEALQWAGLQDHAGQRARLLSAGQQRLLAITRAWVLQPALLLLDEPLNGLDQAARQHLLEYLDRLAEEQRSVLWTSHEEVKESGRIDELWLLMDGQLSREIRRGPQATTVVSFHRPPSGQRP